MMPNKLSKIDALIQTLPNELEKIKFKADRKLAKTLRPLIHFANNLLINVKICFSLGYSASLSVSNGLYS